MPPAQSKSSPYQQIKMGLFGIGDPFDGASPATRREMFVAASKRARSEFDAAFSGLRPWVDTYDPIYLLSFFQFYFLMSEKGVDKEAVEGRIEFGYHHLELLQAVALMGQRSFSPRPLREDAVRLQTQLKSLTDALMLSSVSIEADTPEDEVRKRVVLGALRSQTLAIRNWGYPDQMVRHHRSLCGRYLSQRLSSELGGVDLCVMIDVLGKMEAESNRRLNSHMARLHPMVAAQDFDSCYDAYCASFGSDLSDREPLRHVYETQCDGVAGFKSLLMTHSDLELAAVCTFTVDEIVAMYGSDTARAGIKAVMDEWSFAFGDLAEWNPHHFLYSNPVTARPFVRLDQGVYYWPLSGILAHGLGEMIDVLTPPTAVEKSARVRSGYLEEQVADLCRKAFPDGQVHVGSTWSEGDAVYENDVLVTIDTTAFVIEAKSHRVAPSARRGGELRLMETLNEQVVQASIQARRFVDFLRARPGVHDLPSASGGLNRIDVTKTTRFVPLGITFENLGCLTGNLKECVRAGLIDGHQPVPSMSLYDFETALELLDGQAEKIHYFARRTEIERTMEYFGGELDLIAFYLDTGFCLGDIEDGGSFLWLSLKSKELDPFFMARAEGLTVSKPRRCLSPWWSAILARIEEVRMPGWTEIAYALLSVGKESQGSFRMGFEQLREKVKVGTTGNKYDWIVVKNDTAPSRAYAIVAFPYRVSSREERNTMLGSIASDVEADGPLLGCVVIGMDVLRNSHPYDVLVFCPGHSPHALDFSRVETWAL